MNEQRALVVAPAAELARMLAAPGSGTVDFVASYPDAAVALTRNNYHLVVVRSGAGDLRVLDFIELVREVQPWARVVSAADLPDPARGAASVSSGACGSLLS
jgi:hypothetical protein